MLLCRGHFDMARLFKGLTPHFMVKQIVLHIRYRISRNITKCILPIYDIIFNRKYDRNVTTDDLRNFLLHGFFLYRIKPNDYQGRYTVVIGLPMHHCIPTHPHTPYYTPPTLPIRPLSFYITVVTVFYNCCILMTSK